MDEVKKKVFVGMSGGVDSSVSAALLQKEGHEVVGVFIKVWEPDFLPCTWREERRDAMRASAHLGIPLITLDLEKEYKEGVVDYMIREYSAGRIPNPDVMCNKHVKFGAFLDFAKKNGADFIATGHYAQVQQMQGSTLYGLRTGVDEEKDQSYFLWTLSEEQLAHTLFPIGHLKKSEVRQLAKKFELPNAEKKDSQGLCFMGPVNVKDFLAHYVPPHVGNVLDQNSNIIGTHDGALFYTIGQRHGFHVKSKTTDALAFYVVSKNMEANTITVGTEKEIGAKQNDTQFSVSEMHILTHEWNEGGTYTCSARVRYHGNLSFATITLVGDGVALVSLQNNRDPITPGQSIVFYHEDELLGGGVICLR